MSKFYSRIFALVIIVFAQLAGHAQVATYSFAQSTGTYTAITGGTVLGVPTGNGLSALDDINYTLPAGSFPFNFTFNNIVYTGCTVNTNGYITFGSTAPSTSNYTPISSGAGYAGAVAAWALDLNTIFNISGQTGELRWQTVGTAPNREVVIQWTKFRPAYSTSTTSAYVFDFQIRLAEGSNAIKVVYGGNLAYLVGSTPISGTAQIGLRGATNTDYNNRNNGTGTVFTASTAGTSNTAAQNFNTTTSPPGMPTQGLTYTWTPPVIPPIDLTFVSITGLPTPPCPNSSVPISATIKNTGLAPLDFTLTPATITVNITGGNTQTLTTTISTGTLAPGASQTVVLSPNANFGNGGTNNLNGTVTITGDGIAGNNTATASVSLIPVSTLPIAIDFTGYTGANLSTVFPAWSEGAGTTTPTGTTSTWTSTTGLGGASNTTAKINLYTNTHNEWIVGPRFAATASTMLQFDVAVTDFASVTASDVMGSDDRVSVMVSTDCGITWTEVKAFTAANNLTNTLTQQLVNLSSYAGQNIVVAFKATDGTVDDTPDYDFHIDNVLIGGTCAGLPAGGTAAATPGFVCYGGSVVLSATGAAAGIGISYQWQSAPTASSTWTDIPGATSLSTTINPIRSLQYRLKVTCSNSGLSDFSTALVVSVSGVPTYTALPFTESFETWVNGCGTTDRPGVNWGAVPSTGDNSWRRDDQGTSASWTSNNGAYTPAFTVGAHSARFHSYNAASGTIGDLDLYIDLSSSTASKYVRFDYINASGTDVLKVMLSTDGGQTFTQVGTTLGTQVAWATKEFLVTSNSATAVIRLEATSDFGGSDIGVDNFQVLSGCSGSPVAGTATATAACYGGTSTISLTGNTTGVGGLTYQWQSSPDGITWTDITGATGVTYTTGNLTRPLRYRAVVTCNAGGSSTSTPVTVTISSMPVYAALPYTQGFESWINACGTTDRPDASWGLSPNTSDSSWRRDDQGASASWTSTGGTYSPAFSQGAHSARFHSFIIPAGQTGSMDLFVDMSSTTQDKLLKFDYFNPIGTDSLVIYFSTNGGQTFTRLDSLNVRTAWTTKQIIIPSNTATGVIRFRAYSDFGNGAADLGIDNLQLLIGCSGTPAAGTVSTVSTPVCLGNSTTLTLTGQTAATGITYQWQSSPNNTTWTDIGGATGTTYVATPTANTYYRVVVLCTNTGLSAATAGSLVTVSSASVTSTTAGVRCGIGPVVLSATGSTGTTLSWYGSATGGTALATGPTFTTPTISANTTYYVTAQNNLGTVNATIGAGASTSSSYESPFYHLFGGKKSQYLVLASELNAAGITAGNINSLGFNVVAAGTTYNAFAISLKTTTATSVSSTLQTGLTTVYTAASVTPVVGLNTYTFLAPFAWDGSSNLIVDICWSNNNTGGTSATVKMDATPFAANAYYRADSQTPALVCGATTATSTQNLRPQMVFNAQTGCSSARVAVQATVNPAPAITVLPASIAICSGQSATLAVNSSNPGYTYAWTGGQTGSPIVVSPTTTTKYVVTATDNSAGANNGCVNKDSVTVTVNSLPAPITVTPASSAICLNSVQTLTATGGTVVTSITQASGTAINIPIPDNTANGLKDSLNITGIPTGATIDSVIVSYNITHTFAADVEVNLEGPNGQIVNLMADEGSLSGLGFVNTRVSSDNTLPAFSTSSAPFTATFKADATTQSNLIGTPSITTQTFSDLFTNPNGFWKLRVYDDANLDQGTLINWTIKVAYTAQSNITWTPATGLYTNTGATTPYVAGTSAATVYAKPTTTTTYTVTATNSSGCTRTATAVVTVNTAPAITGQPVSQIACTGSTVVFSVTATGSNLTYQWRKGGVNLGAPTTLATLTLTNVQASDAGSYDVIVSGTCPSPVTSNAATLVVGDDSWTGTSNTDWNNALNWCNGVPTTTTNVLIPSGTPFQPTITANANAANLVINTGATVTITNSGRLSLYGNLTTNGTFNATAGAIEFKGSANQTVPAITAANVIMNGTGGVTLGGTLTVGTALTLTNGNITLGNNNLVMSGGTLGSVASHIITNGTGAVTNNNVTVASVIFPVAPTASSYNPVMIANGQGRNYTVSVATGVTPAIPNSARAVNRTWNITVNTAAPTTPVSIALQYADADANGTPTANMEAGVYNGTNWLTVTPAGGVAPIGTATARVVGFQTVSFGPTILSNLGGISFPTAVSNIDADITSVVLMPNVVENNTVLRIHVRRTMKITWSIVDANGRVVMLFSKQVYAGQNDIPLSLGKLAGGTYQLVGSTDKGKTPSVRLVRL
jgi:subtilisin-like proprotein convertase family protein